MISNNHPFTLVEEKAFREFVLSLSPEAGEVLMSADTLKTHALVMYRQMKALFKTILKNHNGRVNATMDMWSSCNRSGFLGITVSWIGSDWILRDFLLSFHIFESKFGLKLIY